MIPARLLTLATRFNITAVSIAVLCVLLAVQTVRIEGFKIWPISVEGMKAKVERANAAEKAARAAYRAEVIRRATIGTEYEREASNAAQIATVREREIRTIYRDVEVPAQCAAPDDVRSLLSEAIAAANSAATGQPLSPVPGTAAATDAPD